MQNNIIILHNRIYDYSNPDESDVLNQVNLVSNALNELGEKPMTMDIGENPYDDIKKLKQFNPRFVFNLVESVYEKGELTYIGAALLNSLQIQYTGVPLDALFITTNKVLTKKILQLHKIPTPWFYTLSQIDKLEANKKYILKPLLEEGSVGLDEDAVFSTAEIKKLEKFSILSPSHYFIEEYIEGREFNISILGGKEKVDVLHPAEMIFTDFPEGKPRILGYRAKWDEESTEYKNTARSFDTLQEGTELFRDLKNICLNCWESFNLRGYARVDFRVDKNGVPYVLEINGNPCISPDSGFIAAAHHYGVDNKVVVQRICEELN